MELRRPAADAAAMVEAMSGSNFMVDFIEEEDIPVACDVDDMSLEIYYGPIIHSSNVKVIRKATTDTDPVLVKSITTRTDIKMG